MSAAVSDRSHQQVIHPVHGVLLAGAVPLYLGAVLADWAYASSYQVQWTNFSSWLIAGGLVFTGFALLWAVVEALRKDVRRRRRWLLAGLIAATFLFAFVNALVHAKDAWAAMPAALILSVIVFLLALAATWIGFSRTPAGEPA